MRTTWQNTFSFCNYAVSDTQLRDMLTAYYTALETGPMTVASDTGQLDQTTIAASALTTSQTANYKVHYLNDSLHSSAPVYLKTCWWVSTAGGYIRSSATVGTGTDGAGTITGLQKTLANTYTNSNSSTTTSWAMGSGGDGFASAWLAPDNNAAYGKSHSTGIFRTTDSSDAPTDRGVFLYHYRIGTGAPQPNGQMTSLDFKYNTIQANCQEFAFLPGAVYQSPGYPTTLTHAPVMFPLANELHTIPWLVAGFQAEHTFQTYFTDTPKGAEHTYTPILSNRNAGRVSTDTSGTYEPIICVVWEEVA
jgi:hypothetical protein